MKYLLLLLCLSAITPNCFSQGNSHINNSATYHYYDEYDNMLSETEFKSKQKRPDFFTIKNDSLRIVKLTPTKETGQLEDKKQLTLYLEHLVGHKIDDQKPIIIIYHPGKDRCNSSGAATKEMMKSWHDKMEKKITKIEPSEIIYVCKTYAELQNRDKVLNYHEDTEQIIENTFFKFHYPCSSFVIISKNGRFFSGFGEFPKDAVWNALRNMK